MSRGFRRRSAPAGDAGTPPKTPGERELILLVDDEKGVLAALTDQLEKSYEVVAVDRPEKALELLRTRQVAAVVSDQRMPGLTGTELLAEAARSQPAAARILLTGYSDLGAVIDAVNKGQAFFYLSKPWSAVELEQVLSRGVERARLIREKERLLVELGRSNADLETANAELRSFAYAVAHDLKHPLRAMDGFAALLAEELSESLTQTARSHLDRIRSGSRRMAVLTDGLLLMARVAGQRPSREKVDLADLARQILARHQEGEPARSVEVVVPESVPAVADPGLIRVALEALLENAWKFTAPVPGPRIELGVEPGPDEPLFFVRDNGVGFDMEFAGKLFGPFQRLHPAEGFAGEGIGLAVVSRVIRSHGGRILASGAPGKGATFSFSLPSGRPEEGA